MSEILVIGHRNPDTDAICSAIGYADFKRKSGMANVISARCGEINPRIEFVLKKFGQPKPKFFPNVYPKIEDVMQRNVVAIPPHGTIAEAIELMDLKNIRVLPIVAHGHECRGLVSIFKASQYFFPSKKRILDSRKIRASLNNLLKTLSGELVVGGPGAEEMEFVLMVGAFSPDEFHMRLQRYPNTDLAVLVGNRDEIQQLAFESNVRLLIVTGGFRLSQRMMDLATTSRTAVIYSPHDTATTAHLCRTAIEVQNVMDDQFVCFRESERISDCQKLAANSTFTAFPVLNANDRIVGMLSKSDFLRKAKRQLILVDHNELSQAVPGAEENEIIEIVDHHRIGSLTTTQPILFRNEPVGSTSTIIAELFLSTGMEMSPSIAGVLLAGLVTDTLNLTSPTTSNRDAQVLKRLEAVSGVNATEFTRQLFASGSMLTLKPAEEAILVDCKEYQEDGRSFSVAQIEELGFTNFYDKKDQLLESLKQYQKKNGYYFSALLVTDVVKHSSLLLVAGSVSMLNSISYPLVEDHIFELKDVVSRKKQLLPYLTEVMRTI
ncbi:MAG: putative manganese-dependent inorganic diphosphatase [Verrucomicrobia bacterium]|nr:putative manganese-dependent inorganic diphosphatase [Verrucomicrobiota bacterium]